MARIIREVNANPDDVINLLVDEKASEEAGRKLAELWSNKHSNNNREIYTIHPEILEIAIRMSEFQLGKWVAMGERLLGE